MKKLLSLLLVLALIAVPLAGCQAKDPGQAPGASAGADAPAQKPELKFWSLPLGPAELYGGAIQKLLDQYNAEDHGATVKLEVLSWSGFIEQFQTAIAAGTPPDICFAAYYDVARYVAAGEAIDLTDIVEKWEAEKNSILDDFLPGTMDLGKFGDSYYALPYCADGRSLYYRADIIEDELGFTDLDKPVTWDKLLEICAAVKEKYGDEMFPISCFTLDQGSTNAMMNVLFSNGASWVDATGSKGALDDPKALECLEYLKTMQERGYFPDGMVSYNMPDVEKLYDSGMLAMAWKSPFTHTMSNPELYQNTKLMGPIVGPSADQPRDVAWFNGLLGFAQAGHPEETKEFIEWFLLNNESVFIEGGASALPVRDSYYANEFYQTDWMMSQYAKYKDYYTDLSWPAVTYPLGTNQVFIQNMMGKPIEAMLMGSTDLKGELEKTNAEISRTLDDLK